MGKWDKYAEPSNNASGSKWDKYAEPAKDNPKAEGIDPEADLGIGASPVVDVIGKGLQQVSDAVVAGVDAIPGMGYLKKAQAAVAAPIKGQTYEDTVAGYNQDISDRWERNPGAALTGSVLLGSKVPGPAGASALSRIGQQAGVAGADSLGRDDAGLNAEGGVQGAAVAGGTSSALEALPYLGKLAPPVAKYLRDKVGSVGFGVRGDATREYLKNPEQMRSTIEAGEDALLGLKNQVDDAYRNKVTNPLSDAKAGYDEAVMDYADQRARYKNARPPEEIAPELINRVRDMDRSLSEQSSAAFDTLDGTKFDRQAFSDLIQELKGKQLIDGQVPNMGDRQAAYSALDKVEKLVNADPNLSKSTIDQVIRDSSLKGQDLKKIIQALDNESASAYSTYGSRTAAGKIREVRGELDSALKSQAPKYAEAMAPLAEETKLVGALKSIFPDEDTARAALRSTANPDTGRSVMLLLQSLDSKTGSQYAKMLEDYIESQRMIRDPQAGQVLKSFMLNPAKRALSEAEETASKFSRLGAGSSENAIKSSSRTNNFETKKQLSELMGDDFLDATKQYGLAQDFQKTSTNGSRKVNLGGVIGGPLGAVLGGVSDIHGGAVWQKVLDGQIKAAELAQTVAPQYRSILEQAERQGPRALAAAYYAITNGDKK